MRGNLKSAQIGLLSLLLLFLATASGVFAYSAAKSHQAKPVLSVETALKAIDFAAENDISIDSEFSANLRQTINFNRNRYYSPALGRFISKDPIGFLGGHNLWRYTDNNPILYVDPYGLKPPRVEGLSSEGMRKIILANTLVALTIDQFRFRDLVKTGGDWDYKKDHPGSIDWQNFGNYHYGYMGAVSHLFYLKTLLQQAGIAQCQERPPRSLEAWGLPSEAPPYGDDPNDQYWIKQGWQDYHDGLWTPVIHYAPSWAAEVADVISQKIAEDTKCPKKDALDQCEK